LPLRRDAVVFTNAALGDPRSRDPLVHLLMSKMAA